MSTIRVKETHTRLQALAVISACALAVSGCATAGRRARAKAARDKAAVAEERTQAAEIPDVDVSEASVRGNDFATAPELETIHFEYDSANLPDAAAQTLKKNAAYLKSQSGLEVLVAGSCDDRGTVEYNLALGQKRAKEVREYYIRLGVPAAALGTISYGKESPLCSDATEECRNRNRRAETKVRAHAAPAPATAAESIQP